MICTSMFLSSMYLAWPSAAARKSSCVTPAGPALSWPIGEAIGVLDPIIEHEEGVGAERHRHVAVDVEHADVVVHEDPS